jgi:hypothetical protein
VNVVEQLRICNRRALGRRLIEQALQKQAQKKKERNYRDDHDNEVQLKKNNKIKREQHTTRKDQTTGW